MKINLSELKRKVIIFISMLLLICSISLESTKAFAKADDYVIKYEYVNIKDMAQAKIATKSESSNVVNNIIEDITNPDEKVVEVALPEKENTEVVAVELPVVNNSGATVEDRPIWYLPTEMGDVSQNPHWGHAALDITSPRGSGELIFPVANGVISGIYRDYAGALIVTVLHDINGKKYTSQYVHLSSYADGLYVGKPVTVNDCLGTMGSTGVATGVHLHLAVVDCALFDPNDPNCSDLSGFFRYANRRVAEGDLGLGSLIWVPGSWRNR